MKLLKKKAKIKLIRKEKIDKRMAAVCAALVVALALSIVVAAAYDPTSDPFVTLSYINNTLKSQLDEEFLDKMGYNSYSELKNAIKSGSAFDTKAVVENAKNGVLDELGYSSWSRLKSAINSGVSDSDRTSLNTYIQNNFLEKLGYRSTDDLKSAIESGSGLTDEVKESIKDEAISKLLADLGFESIEDLKNALSGQGGNSETITSNTIEDLCNALGFANLDEMMSALKNDDSNTYHKITFKRGDVITAVSQCEVVVKDGLSAFESYLGSGTNMTLGNIPTDGEIMNENAYLLLESGSRLVVVGGNCTIMIRGTYIVTQVELEK